jgi:hypothetical protein
MQTRTGTFDVLADDSSDPEPHFARLRFGAIVRTLSQAPATAPLPGEPDDWQPTRRLNRTRKLLGKLPLPGKSRRHARRIR